MDVLTLTTDLSIRAAGGPAMILNPINMEVLDNDVISDEWVDLQAGTQLMMVGAFDKTDTWWLVVSDAGDLSESEGTFGLVVRRATFDKIVNASVSS